VLADGRNVAGSRYATVTGQTTVPDLRGAFIRAAGQNSNNGPAWNGGTVGAFHDDTTRLPRNTAFTTDSQGAHVHGHGTGAQINSDGGPNWKSGFDVGKTDSAGAHTHTIRGGDVETAPSHFSLNTFMKIN
jgi:hypothetical protein